MAIRHLSFVKHTVRRLAHERTFLLLRSSVGSGRGVVGQKRGLRTRAFERSRQESDREQNNAPSTREGFFTPGYEVAKSGSSSSSPLPSSSNSNGPSGRAKISDHEYEIRVGRAFDLLSATIPEFMRIGLVDYDQQNKQHTSSSSGMTLLDVLNFRSLRDRAGEQRLIDSLTSDRQSGSGGNSLTAASGRHPDYAAMVGDGEKAYHETIHFRFCAHASTSSTNNTADLTDEEAASLSFSGRNLYFASAHVLRHTLNILFSDSSVTIESIRRERRRKKANASAVEDERHRPSTTATMMMRGDTIYLRVGFVGHLRVTGAEHHYTLVFRYEIDEESGKIVRHTVERIEPAIGRKLWSGLAAVWLRLTGYAHPQPVASAVPVTNFRRQASTPAERHRCRLLDAHAVRQAQKG